MTRQHTGFLMVQLDILWFGATPHADLDSRQGNEELCSPQKLALQMRKEWEKHT